MKIFRKLRRMSTILLYLIISILIEHLDDILYSGYEQLDCMNLDGLKPGQFSIILNHNLRLLGIISTLEQINLKLLTKYYFN